MAQSKTNQVSVITVLLTDAEEWPKHGTNQPAAQGEWFQGWRGKPITIMNTPLKPTGTVTCDTDFVWPVTAETYRAIVGREPTKQYHFCRHQIQIGD